MIVSTVVHMVIVDGRSMLEDDWRRTIELGKEVCKK